MLGNNSYSQLRRRKSSGDNIVPIYSRRVNNGLDLNKTSFPKAFKMALTWKTMIFIGELFSGIFTGGMFFKYGIGDIKTIIGIIFIVAFGVIRLWKGYLEIQEKKQSLREREYDFNKKVTHDKEISLKKH